MNEQIIVPRGRLAAVGFIALLLQTTVISQVPPFAGSADIVPLVAMSVGLVLGSLPGAVFGFGIGLGLDLIVGQPLGQYALINLAIGYGAGRVFEIREPAGSLVLLPLGAAAAGVSTVGYGVLQVLLGGGAELSSALVQQALLAVVWGALLAVPTSAATRRMIGGANSRIKPRQGRSRAYATGGLSPLTPGRKR